MVGRRRGGHAQARCVIHPAAVPAPSSFGYAAAPCEGRGRRRSPAVPRGHRARRARAARARARRRRGDGREALGHDPRFEPQVAVLDLRLPEPRRAADPNAVARDGMPSRVLVPVGVERSGLVYAAMRTGAAGYFPRRPIARPSSTRSPPWRAASARDRPASCRPGCSSRSGSAAPRTTDRSSPRASARSCTLMAEGLTGAADRRAAVRRAADGEDLPGTAVREARGLRARRRRRRGDAARAARVIDAPRRAIDQLWLALRAARARARGAGRRAARRPPGRPHRGLPVLARGVRRVGGGGARAAPSHAGPARPGSAARSRSSTSRSSPALTYTSGGPVLRDARWRSSRCRARGRSGCGRGSPPAGPGGDRRLRARCRSCIRHARRERGDARIVSQCTSRGRRRGDVRLRRPARRRDAAIARLAPTARNGWSRRRSPPSSASAAGSPRTCTTSRSRRCRSPARSCRLPPDQREDAYERARDGDRRDARPAARRDLRAAPVRARPRRAAGGAARDRRPQRGAARAPRSPSRSTRPPPAPVTTS